MNFNTRTSRTPLALASTAVMAGLLLTGCGQGTDPGTQETSAETTAASQPAESPEGNAMDQEALLKINEQLSETLGEDYVQGWIKRGVLHVSTTNEDKLPVIEEAGATGHLVQFSSEQLRSGIAKIMQWQAQQENPVRSAIHAYTLNPETGGITLSVDESQLDEVKELIEADQPVGDIPVDYQNSGGFASPASTE